MKNFKRLAEKTVAVGFGIMSFILFAQISHADPSLAGSYRGRYMVDGKPRIDLVMRPLTEDGRDGSYLGVLLQNSPLKIAVYLIDRTEDGKYVMQPRQVTGDGEVVGTTNVDPSLVLNLTGIRNGLQTFTITNANASNQNGFQGSMVFRNDDFSDLTWLDMNPGVFSIDGNRVAIGSTMVDHETGISLTLPGSLSGEYTLREKLPAVYTLTNVSVTAAGDQRAKLPTNIVLFLRKPSIFGSNDFFVMIDPTNYENVVKVVRHLFER